MSEQPTPVVEYRVEWCGNVKVYIPVRPKP
jgi:hypothetical protein